MSTSSDPVSQGRKRPTAGIAIDTGRLVWARQRRGLSRQQLADITMLPPDARHPAWHPMSRDALNKIENGYRHPKPSTLKALSDALGVQPHELMPQMPEDGAAPGDTERKRPISGIAIDTSRLIWARESKAMSRQELADSTRLPPDGKPLSVIALAKIEAGSRRPRPGTLKALSDALGVQPHELMLVRSMPGEASGSL